MADIFISYARKGDVDLAQVRTVAEALEALGYEVFWDEKIPPGVDYDEYLENKLQGAHSILVLWSSAARLSRWVKEEARYGRDAGKLLPARIDGSPPPLGFTSIQTVDLSEWTGQLDDENWQALVREISRRCGRPRPRGASRVSSSTPWHIVLVIDDSGSMSGEAATSVNESLEGLVMEMQILGGGRKNYFRFSLISYGSAARVIAEALGENEIDMEHIRVFSGLSGSTNIADALRCARDVLLRNPGSRNDFVPYVFILTDGSPDDAAQALFEAEQLKQTELPAGFPRIVALGLGKDHDHDFMRAVASSDELYLSIDDFRKIMIFFPSVGSFLGSAKDLEAAIGDII